MNDTRLKVMEAIARQKAVTALYNDQLIKLAPHVLFERRGELYVSALNLSKTWRNSEERRLGQFKLAGLTAPDVLDEGFEPLPSFQPAAPRSDDTLLLTI
jgi:hypothetical protein